MKQILYTNSQGRCEPVKNGEKSDRDRKWTKKPTKKATDGHRRKTRTTPENNSEEKQRRNKSATRRQMAARKKANNIVNRKVVKILIIFIKMSTSGEVLEIKPVFVLFRVWFDSEEELLR